MLNRLRRRSERGQALLEFALLVPVLSVILFGLTEIGLALNNQVSMMNAARNGARVAALNGGSTGVSTAVSDAAGTLPRCSSATSAVNGSLTAGWTVTASCTYTPITPLAPLFGFFNGSAGSTYTLSAQSTMKDASCTPPGCH